MGNHLSSVVTEKLEEPTDQVDPKQSFETLQVFVHRMNILLAGNITFFKANFDIDFIQIEATLATKNHMFDELFKFAFNWGAGTNIKIVYRKHGMNQIKQYASVSSFIADSKKINEVLGDLKLLNKEFRGLVQQKRGEESKDDDYNLCGICLCNSIEMALQCGHSFCEDCINNWRKKQTSCPMCRYNSEAQAYYLVEYDENSTVAMRADLMKRLHNLIGQLLDEA